LYGRAFAALPVLKRTILKYRPFICPLEELPACVPKGSSVLDIGCGCGLFLLALAFAGKRISGVGIDRDRDAIRAARLAARVPGIRAGSRLSFEIAPGIEAWPAGQFDVVSLIDVLHHVPASGQRQFVIAAASRVRPGGILIYKDMCRRPVWRSWANRLHDLVLARQWIRYRELAEVREWAAFAGLVPESRRDFVRLWYGHELYVFRMADAA
jgi:2-polyprenyl-3-methyl-5-hydroxy-6-metoxy-1,4-benzoquinol methylase